jgi:hypothetical protein
VTDQASRAYSAAVDDVAREGGPSQRRRRLIKGAFSAPIVLTLCNGAAVAASSHIVTVANLGVCDDNNGNNGNTNVTSIVGDPAACVIPDGGSCTSYVGGEKCDVGDDYTYSVVSAPREGFKCNNDFFTTCPGDGGVIITSSSATSLVL